MSTVALKVICDYCGRELVWESVLRGRRRHWAPKTKACQFCKTPQAAERVQVAAQERAKVGRK